jgi:uncharacterized protein
MKIIFEINHPGQVHLLRHTYHDLTEKKHVITVFAKNEKVILRLLDHYNIPYVNLGNKGSGISGKFFRQLLFDFKIWKHVLVNKPALGVGSSMTNDHVSFLSVMKSIHLSDDDEDIVPLLKKFSYPFSDTILAPDSLLFNSYPEKVIGYSGTHELAYLHPNRFTPDITVLEKAGMAIGQSFFILRFVALQGHHDVGHQGISYEQKKALIELLKPHGRIIITSEKEIEPEFEQYRLPVAPEEIHSLMYYASMFLGDSQTMTSEAAILGVPALKCNTFAGKLSVPNELEQKYGLCYSYQPRDFDKLYYHAKELISSPGLKQEWQYKREKFLADKIDVTAFMVWFIENYPESKRIMKEDPDNQFRFQ